MAPEKETEEKPEQKAKSETYEVVEVPASFGLAYKNNETEEVLTQEQLLVRIANDVSEIKKAVA